MNLPSLLVVALCAVAAPMTYASHNPIVGCIEADGDGDGGGKKPPKAKPTTYTVKSVDATAKTVTVNSGAEGAADETITVADDTKIRINGEDKALADLTADMKVQVTKDDAGKVTSIEVPPAKGEKKKKH